MLSVVIPTLDSERALVRTLSPLVAGAAAGLVREVIVADAGSRDETAAVADVAGCTFLTVEGPLGRRLRAAAAKARARWLLFLQPGIVLDPAWTADASRFIESPANADRAAVFRPTDGAQPALVAAFSLLTAGLAAPRSEQGLLIARRLYDALGGHPERGDSETDLLRRIGRRRITVLDCRAAIVR
jgi:glycosyltransferase involved in cell wall biosynthesis